MNAQTQPPHSLNAHWMKGWVPVRHALQRIGYPQTTGDRCRTAINHGFAHAGEQIEHYFKRWSQPAHANLLLGTVTDLTRSKSALIAENAFLRHQLIILRRH
jgi:hypothetical protein